MSNPNLSNELNQPKTWLANLVFTLLEIASVIVYCIFAVEAIVDAIKYFDLEGMFDAINIPIWILSGIVFVYSLVFLVFKKLRTSYVKSVAISNLIWVAFNVYGLLF